MYLLHSVLQKATAITHMASGRFTSPDSLYEVAVVKGASCIDILKIAHGPLGTKLVSVVTVNTFSLIKSVHAIRLPGEAVDMLAICSDSGCFVLAKVKDSALERLFIHPYAKSGCQRTSPGHFLKVDPLGRAILLSAIEYGKIVYILEREGAESEDLGKMKVRSPLEANRAGQATLAVEFLANTRSNPRFVALEKDLSSLKLMLVAYEVEIGLNHIVRIATLDVDLDAYDVMALPCGEFVVFGETSVSFYSCLGINKIELVQSIDAFGLVTSHCNMKWVQTEPGQLYVIEHRTLTLVSSSMSPSRSIAVLNDAYLLCAAISGSHKLYQIAEREPFLQQIDELPNLSPILCSAVHKTRSGRKEDAVNLFVSIGDHLCSTFNCVKPGLSVYNIATSDLPEPPKAIFRASADLYAICFPTRSTFLRVGQSIEEDTNVSFDCQIPYILVSELERGSGIIAVYSGGWRQAEGGKMISSVEWRANGVIVSACANARQLAVALSDGSLFYFELTTSGQMREAATIRLSSPITCMSFASVPIGRQRSRFLVIGGQDSVIRLLSCDPDDRMAQLALQAAAQPPTSLMFTLSNGQLMLHVGLKSGVYVRLTVEKTTGAISDPQSRYLGPAPVHFFPCSPPGLLIASSTKPWMIYSSGNHKNTSMIMMASLSISSDFISFAPFHTENIPNALMAISQNSTFSVLLVNDYDLSFASIHSSLPAKYTVRRQEYVEELGLFVTVESSAQGRGRVSVVSEDLAQTLTSIDFECFVHSALLTRFGESTEWHLLVGASNQFDAQTRHSNGSFISTFLFDPQTNLATELYKTDYCKPPNVMVPFVGKVLIGCEEAIRMYDLGKKRMLRKCQVKVSSSVHFLDSQGTRIYAGTSLQSLMVFVYRQRENQMQCFADDILSRPLSAMTVLDYETVLIADRMGCLSVLRVPTGLSESMEKDPAGLTSAVRETLFAAPNKLERVCEFTVGEIITGLSKCTLFLGARQSILYTTIHGTIGNLSPIQFRSTAAFLQSMESELRNLMHPNDSFPLCSLTGRHQLLWRSHLGQTVKGIIDGTFLLESFTSLSADLKLKVSGVLDKDPSEITRLVRDNMCIF